MKLLKIEGPKKIKLSYSRNQQEKNHLNLIPHSLKNVLVAAIGNRLRNLMNSNPGQISSIA